MTKSKKDELGMNNKSLKRVALIGYGGMGNWHVRKILAGGAVELAGIYDIDPKRVDAAHEKDIYTYSSLEELLADKSVEIVTIATPNQLHKPLAIQAMAAGKHVISEKPVTLSSEDLQEMIDASKKYGRLFTVHQNRRWDAEYLMMKEVYDSGKLGEVFGIQSIVHGSHGIPGDWRGHKEFGGGMILDWGVHLIDQMLCIVEDLKIKSVYCKCDHITNYEVDDGFKLDIYFENGLTGRIEVGTSNFINMPRYYMTGTNGSAIIPEWNHNCKIVACTNWDPGDVVPVVTAAGLTKTMAPRSAETISESEIIKPVSDVHDFYRNVVKAIDGEEEQIVTHAQLMRVMKVMEAAFKSDELGIPVAFNE